MHCSHSPFFCSFFVVSLPFCDAFVVSCNEFSFFNNFVSLIKGVVLEVRKFCFCNLPYEKDISNLNVRSVSSLTRSAHYLDRDFNNLMEILLTKTEIH